MPNGGYIRKYKKERPVVAICYDFDKTLSPDDMQAQGFIQAVGYEISKFWKESNGLAGSNDMDQNLAYMFKMMETAEGRVLFTKKALLEYGTKVRLFPGVEDWFRRIREYGEDHGVIVEHYIISSGLKEMIEGTAIANEFEKIYASTFFYSEKGVAKWPCLLYTSCPIRFTAACRILENAIRYGYRRKAAGQKRILRSTDSICCSPVRRRRSFSVLQSGPAAFLSGSRPEQVACCFWLPYSVCCVTFKKRGIEPHVWSASSQVK